MDKTESKTVDENFVFLLQIETPTDTLRRIAFFFQDHGLEINDFSLHRFQDGNAMVIANTMIAPLILPEAIRQLHLLPGILKVQVMNK